MLRDQPPYWGQRDYDIAPQTFGDGWQGQLGQEPTPELYVLHLQEIFREVKRVLRDDGTLWLNIGDTYMGGKGRSAYAWNAEHPDRQSLQKPCQHYADRGEIRPQDRRHQTLKPKDLVGIPWRVALSLQADGWWLRQDIIWYKPNCTPESVKDRCTRSHEYIFLLSKGRHYYYDYKAIKEPLSSETIPRLNRGVGNGHKNAGGAPGQRPHTMARPRQYGAGYEHIDLNGRNKRSVWVVPVGGYDKNHYATYPPALIKPCILAGCPEGGVVLDPFSGTGTTGLVACALGRNYIGIDMKEEYNHHAAKRIKESNPLLCQVAIRDLWEHSTHFFGEKER